MSTPHLTKILRRDPPTEPVRLSGPSTELDTAIVSLLARKRSWDMRPSEIAGELGFQYTSQQITARLRVLVDRGQVEKIRPAGAPVNGPGAAVYRKVRAG